jgi:hypothetical protein
VDRIERALQNRLQKQPDAPVRLIVRIVGDMPQAEKQLGEMGANVVRTFSLTKAVAVTCSAATALSLVDEPWVQSIEEDRQVTAQPPGDDGASSCGGEHD